MLNNSGEENTPQQFRIEGLTLEIGGLRLHLQAVEVSGVEASLRPNTAQATPDEPLIAPNIPPAIARRLTYLWLLSFRLEEVIGFVEEYSIKLSERVQSPHPEEQQNQTVALEAVYAIEQALGTGDRKELSNPYKSLHNNLSRYFSSLGVVELPKGFYGWRHFFIERSWHMSPPAWMQAHLPRPDEEGV